MDQAQKRFLSSLSALLAKMAMADGVLVPEELSKVSSIWNKLGLTSEQSEYCELSFKIAQKDGVPFQRYVQEFVASRFGIDAREFLYGLMWEVACADDVLHRREKSILEALQNGLGLPSDSYDIYYSRYIRVGRVIDEEVEEQKKTARQKAEEARRRATQEEARRRAEDDARRRRERARRSISIPHDIDSAYALLGCTPVTAIEDLKRAYRAAAMRWHPDRLRSDGVPQELIDKANEKMAAYNAAWDIIKRHRKIV